MEQWQIKKPEWLQVQWDNHVAFGYNQEWYKDAWQRLAGCGPTTATQVVSYVKFRDGLLDSRHANDGKAALARMETVWNYVKPRYGGGLYKTQWFEKGLENYFAETKLPYDVHMLNVHPFALQRPSVGEVTEFLKSAMLADCPVGFLNRHRGQEESLYTWHWVPLIGVSKNGEEVVGTVYDEEKEFKFSLNKWLKDTLLGGGFVYVTQRA